MPSSNSRIIAAENVAEAVPFTLGALPSAQAGTRRRNPAFGRPEAAAPPASDPVKTSFEAGYRKGSADAQAAAAMARQAENKSYGLSLTARVDAIAASFENEIVRFHEHAADKIVDLAIEIARQIVRATLEQSPDAIVPVVQETIAAIVEAQTHARLLVNPADVASVNTQLAPLLAKRNIELVPEASIAKGGCRLLSATTEVDATLQTRWQRTLASIGRPDAPPVELKME